MAEEGQVNWEEFSNQKRLDLSKKSLTSLKGIGKCKELTWLNLSNNAIESLHFLRKVKNLVVLNASNNKISTVHHILHLKDLKALILNNNCLVSAEGLERLSQLNALVLSRNQIESVDVSNLSNISKLSLSHNKFKGVPDLENLASLKELRLNDNEIEDIPASICHCKSLKLADFGNNKINSFGFLDKLSQTGIENLNLKGNPISSSPDYKEKIISAIPLLKILDGRRIEQKASEDILKVSEKASVIEEEVPASIENLGSKNTKSERDQEGGKSKKVGGFISRFKGRDEPLLLGEGKELDIGKKEDESSGKNKDVEFGEIRSGKGKTGKRKKEKQKKKKVDSLEEDEVEKCIESTEGQENKADNESGINAGVSLEIVKNRKRKLDRETRQNNKKSKKKKVRKDIGVKSEKKDANIEQGEKDIKSSTGQSVEADRPTEKSPHEGLNTKRNGAKKKKKSKSEEGSKRKEQNTTNMRNTDKRSGVVGLEIVRRRKGKSDIVMEMSRGYDFGTGESEGW